MDLFTYWQTMFFKNIRHPNDGYVIRLAIDDRGNMADRKQFPEVPEVNEALTRLLESSRESEVTEDELREQRISFAFGNALGSEAITKESVRQSSKHVRLLY
jgi:hypothetical protein